VFRIVFPICVKAMFDGTLEWEIAQNGLEILRGMSPTRCRRRARPFHIGLAVDRFGNTAGARRAR
jgi:hypothetical protein